MMKPKIRAASTVTVCTVLSVAVGLFWLAQAGFWSESAPNDVKPVPTADPGVQLAEQTAASFSSRLEAQWGIRITGIALAEAERALNLRYEVVDPDKAAQLYDGATKAFLLDVDHENAIQIGAPPAHGAVGSRHSRARSQALMMREAGSFPPPPSRIQPGKIYSVLVPNLNRAVKRGNQVAVIIGRYSTEQMTVQ